MNPSPHIQGIAMFHVLPRPARSLTSRPRIASPAGRPTPPRARVEPRLALASLGGAALVGAGLLGSLLMVPDPAEAQQPEGFDQAWEALSHALTDSLEASGMVGASWAFLYEGELGAWETFGYADLESRRPVDRGTIFHWGSITKTLTGIAIMQLRDQGLLHLDDPILDYLPELRAVHNPFGSMTDITIRHLLSHSAGFRSPTWPWGGGEDWHPHEPTEWEQVVAMLPYTEVLFPPGSRFSYSNPGIIFLGRVVEDLAGEEWEVYVEKNILRPLDMRSSYFDFTPRHLLPDRSNNYWVRDGVPEANGLDFNTGITVSNGGLNAPFEDMAKYLLFLLNDGGPDKQSVHDGVLKRSSLQEMWEEEVEAGESGGLREALALTFFLEEHNGVRYVGHTGSQKAFQAFVYVHPESGVGAICAFNSTGVAGSSPARPATRAIMNNLRLRMFEDIFPLFR